jgi:hypothetical protein
MYEDSILMEVATSSKMTVNYFSQQPGKPEFVKNSTTVRTSSQKSSYFAVFYSMHYR